MSDTLAIITGASSGIGAALAGRAAERGAAVATLSRRDGPGRHLSIDLSDPAGWPKAARWIGEQIAGFPWDRVVMVHGAATLEPIGFAGEVDGSAYASNVLLNSAAPQVLGHAFIESMAGAAADGVLVLISSGAARTPYAGWSSYCAGKAACDQWVRAVGLEQAERGGRVRVVSVAPGVVATGMQERIRRTERRDFPRVERFQALHDDGDLRDAQVVAAQLWDLVTSPPENGTVTDLRSAG